MISWTFKKIHDCIEIVFCCTNTAEGLECKQQRYEYLAYLDMWSVLSSLESDAVMLGL